MNLKPLLVVYFGSGVLERQVEGDELGAPATETWSSRNQLVSP